MINLQKTAAPQLDKDVLPVQLTDETMDIRKASLLKKMQADNFDAVVIYADLEHGGNFEYFTGFVPRFEEALLVIHQSGEAYLVLGNENLNKVPFARIAATAVHLPHFSLPNQPMETTLSVSAILKQTKLEQAASIGLIGWMNFTSQHDDNAALYDLPYFLVDGLKQAAPEASFKNAAYLMIGENGLRTTNNANEIAHYEFGAMLAGNCILNAMDQLAVGKSEMEIGAYLNDFGQTPSVVTIMATGARFEKANLYPTGKKIQLGDRISMTSGYKGGLQSRGGYAVHTSEELPEAEQDYLERVAKPYFNAVKTWFETIAIDMPGAELYNKIEEVLPKEQYGWHLNPGHLCADEEWLASPIYPDSSEKIKSGMLFQFDIISSVPGYSGASCEGGVVLADEQLRAVIQNEYPEMWSRMQARRSYLIEEIGIKLSEEVLPMSNAAAYYRPFFLNKESALSAK
ncbi:M24 family metallopeptidase [Enterococcus hulanensis]|uniref:M24 family metallopeptidase n=1 Tax=Enterococcus hulanensis TaxID=2559929 RepID=A0ABU3ETE7_9ENTE|nr:M24 family metallopeptidase [Enterococcus hulanensis]MDT2598133.1 M24 family metallopeptidase [Enterococcus hulanensis]MDT2608361.1 M24 family metallopeptidase [Enterococcus hulanensis]MDT2615656.1 M24 family metallopeptidase [Enterococcus hulanensis]MDT2626373.1 M24 family metallopeptidase [Enterococcus hulanensis]MDT2654728.1 M24 family metallopeptidase [Enterococcus hulanensis]